jgi:hypothetical protein
MDLSNVLFSFSETSLLFLRFALLKETHVNLDANEEYAAND